MNGVPAFEPLHKVLLLLREFLPTRNGVLFIEEAHPIDEVLKVLQRHLGILSIGIGREQSYTPTQRAFSTPFYKCAKQLTLSALQKSQSRRIDSAQPFR